MPGAVVWWEYRGRGIAFSALGGEKESVFSSFSSSSLLSFSNPG